MQENVELENAVKAVREEMLRLVTYGETVPKEIVVNFAAPAWTTDFPGPRWYQSQLIEFYWDPTVYENLLIMAKRSTNAHQSSFMFHDDLVFEIRTDGITEWFWTYSDTLSQGGGISKAIIRNGELVAEYRFDAFEPRSTSGDEKLCDLLYRKHIQRDRPNTSLYRLDHGEVLVQPHLDDQLRERGAADLSAIAARLREIDETGCNFDGGFPYPDQEDYGGCWLHDE
jgi:hypothetical protein